MSSMQLVETTTRTTLLLNRNFQAFSFCSARAAFKHLITGRVKGMDADGNVISWDGSDLDTYPSQESLYSWGARNVKLFPNQPFIRSAPDRITGEEKQWPIPTIAVCSHHFGYHSKKGDNVSLRQLFSIYKGQCQYCLNQIPFSQATKDHVYPRSKGGSNHDFNLVLACRRCNSEKDDIFPYYDVDGKEVKPRRMLSEGMFVPDSDQMRPEWKPFLYQD